MKTDCPHCGGNGDVRHPRWGARNCPDPYVLCPNCGGRGWVYATSVADEDSVGAKTTEPACP